MSAPKRSQRRQTVAAYNPQTIGGAPIKIMTAGLLALTIGFAYDLCEACNSEHRERLDAPLNFS